MSRILITGASGFIGRRVLNRLAGGNDAVLAVGRSPVVGEGVSWQHVDLLDCISLKRVVAEFKPEILIHLGWFAQPGRYLIDPLNVELLHSSITLVQAALTAGCRHFVGAGSCSEYDSRWAPMEEENVTAPSTPYAACKLALHVVGAQLAAQAGATWAWGRIFHLYGPGEDVRRLVPAAIISLLENRRFSCTEGQQVRDFLHVDDVAAAFVTLAKSGASGTYNVASGHEITVREILRSIGRIIDREGLLGFGERPANLWDPPAVWSKAEPLRKLGWKPTINLDEGLRQTIEWWRNEARR